MVTEALNKVDFGTYPEDDLEELVKSLRRVIDTEKAIRAMGLECERTKGENDGDDCFMGFSVHVPTSLLAAVAEAMGRHGIVFRFVEVYDIQALPVAEEYFDLLRDCTATINSQ
jgi:hypothetical protein